MFSAIESHYRATRERFVFVLHHVMDDCHRTGVTECVDLLGEALHCRGPPLPAKHLIAGQLILKLRWRKLFTPRLHQGLLQGHSNSWDAEVETVFWIWFS